MEHIGYGQWDVEAVKEAIRTVLTDSTNPHDELVLFRVVIVPPDQEVSAETTRELWRAFHLNPPVGGPDNYDPGFDEQALEDIDLAAAEDADALSDALVADPMFLARMERSTGSWSLLFGHENGDGDYCLFLRIIPSARTLRRD